MTRLYKYKDSVFESMYKNTRRICAYFKQSKIKRIKIYIMLVALVLATINPVYAVIENDDINYGNYNILSQIDEFAYASYNGKQQPNIQYYYLKDKEKIPAYCLNYGMKGAEEGEYGHDVDVSQKINDDALKMIVLNGYPYKTLEELKINTIPEAVFATQCAIWCYVDSDKFNIENIKPLSHMNDRLIECISEIYNAKDGNIEDYNIDIDFNVSNQENVVIDGQSYYKRKIDLVNKKNIKCINIDSKDNNIKIEKLNEDSYNVYIKTDIVKEKYSVNIDLSINAKENVVLFGKSKEQGYQDIALTLKDDFSTTIEKEIQFLEYETNVKIIKKDKDTNKGLKNTKYHISDDLGLINGEYITDENGEINLYFNNSQSMLLKIKEVEADSNYIIDDFEYSYNISSNDNKEIELFNKKKKGFIEIYKRTKEYNEITNIAENSPLKGVIFTIFNDKGEVVDTLTTNEQGYAKSKELELGKYYIEETETNKYYEKLKERIEVEILKNEDKVNVQVLNVNAFIQRKLPVTGR